MRPYFGPWRRQGRNRRQDASKPCGSRQASAGLSIDEGWQEEEACCFGSERLLKQCYSFLQETYAQVGEELPSVSISKLPSAVTVAGTSALVLQLNSLDSIAGLRMID